MKEPKKASIFKRGRGEEQRVITAALPPLLSSTAAGPRGLQPHPAAAAAGKTNAGCGYGGGGGIGERG